MFNAVRGFNGGKDGEIKWKEIEFLKQCEQLWEVLISCVFNEIYDHFVRNDKGKCIL